MYTLFLDTHSEDVIIILYKDRKIIEERIENSKFQHSQITLPLLKEVLENHKLKPEDLNELVVVIGPGSFTGVRISVTIAKTMAYTLNIPIKILDSLQVKSYSVPNPKEDYYISIEDKNGAYVGQFNNNHISISDYKYLNKNEYKESKENNNYIETEPNYESLIDYIKELKPINPHKVNPLYIKHIGVEK